MAAPSPLRRGSLGHGHPLPSPSASNMHFSSSSAYDNGAAHLLQQHQLQQHQQQQQLLLREQRHSFSSSVVDNEPPVHPSLLQPRVAVVLNVPPPWHPWLFALRLVSVLPAAWWGLPSLLQLMLRLLPGPEMIAADSLSGGPTTRMYALTETGLATIWCFASGYLSFFFTDCLMSRWLINYTPQATMVRLLTINVCNAYITAGVLTLAGGFRDPRLLLPGWIGIATTFTVVYHITHQKINIRKETSTSVNVFSIASFISMIVLLAHMHLYDPEYPKIPLITAGRLAWEEASRVAVQVSQQKAEAGRVDL